MTAPSGKVGSAAAARGSAAAAPAMPTIESASRRVHCVARVSAFMFVAPLVLSARPGAHTAPSRCSFHDERIAATRPIVDPHALGLQVAVHGLGPILPAEAGGLVAAERHQEAHGPVGVDPHGAGLDAF